MNYVARRYRVASHVGGVRKRLAKMLKIKLEADGLKDVEVNPSKLWPNLGVWRTNTTGEYDCCTWHGQFEHTAHGKRQTGSVESWDRMTTLLRGFYVRRAGFMSYDCVADNEMSIRDRFKVSASRWSI
jgi:hypothetical protein